MRFAKAGVPGYSLDAPEDHDKQRFDELDYLMVWYGDIRARAARGMHFEPVLLTEIQAYEHFLGKLGIKMSAFEWEMMFRLDAVWQDCVPEPEGAPPKSKRQKPTAH